MGRLASSYGLGDAGNVVSGEAEANRPPAVAHAVIQRFSDPAPRSFKRHT